MKQEQAYLTCFKILRIERAGGKFLEKILEEYKWSASVFPFFPAFNNQSKRRVIS